MELIQRLSRRDKAQLTSATMPSIAQLRGAIQRIIPTKHEISTDE